MLFESIWWISVAELLVALVGLVIVRENHERINYQYNPLFTMTPTLEQVDIKISHNNPIHVFIFSIDSV